MGTPRASAGALFLSPVSTRKARDPRVVTVERSRQKVLNEEEYIEGLQTDFFPDVEKRQAQKEYVEAEGNGDSERMRHIATKFDSALGKLSRNLHHPVFLQPTLIFPRYTQTLLCWAASLKPKSET